MTVGWRDGQTWPRLIADSRRHIGDYQVRRVFDPGFPPSFTASHLRHDHGQRAQAWSFKPPSNMTVAQVRALLRSIPDPSRVYVIPWHEPVDNMSAAEYRRRYDIVYEAYTQVPGFAGIGTCITNWTLVHGHRDNGPGLAYVQPDKSDFLSVDTYQDLDQNGWPLKPAVEALDKAIRFANEHGLKLAIDEFGVAFDRSRGDAARIADQADWIRSFAELGDVCELDRICYWNDEDVNGSFWLDNHATFNEALADVRDHFATPDPEPDPAPNPGVPMSGIPIVGPPSAALHTLHANASRLNAAPWYHDALASLWVAGVTTGLDPVVLAAQCAIETGWGRFGREVTPEQGNTCGLRNFDGDSFADFPMMYGRFPSVGAVAHAHHLGAYAGLPVPADSPNPRSRFVTPDTTRFGVVTYVEELGGSRDGVLVWASDPEYGTKVRSAYDRLTAA